MSAARSKKTAAPSLQHVENERFDGDRNAFLDWLNQEINHLVFSDLSACRELVDQLTEIIGKMTGDDRARLLRMQARFFHMTGNPSKALQLYRRAEQIYHRLGDREAIAMIAKAKVDALMYLGRYREALEIGRKTAEYFRRRGRTIDQAQVLTNIGNVYHRLDQLRPALRSYNRARKLMGKNAPPRFLATIDYNRANILSSLNKLDQAAELYREAERQYQAAQMEMQAEHCRYSLGYLSYLRGEYAKAQERFEQVREKLGQLGDRRGKAVAELDIVEILVATNRFTEALAMVPELTDEFSRLKMKYELGKVMVFAGRAYIGLADYPAAGKALRKAGTIFTSEKNHLWSMIVRYHTAELALLRGRIADALRLARESSRGFARVDDRLRHSLALILVGHILLRQGKPMLAERAIRPVLKQVASLPASILFPVYHLQGRIADSQGRQPQAIAAYRRATRQLRILTAGVNADESRLIFLADKHVVFRDLATALVENGQYRAGLKVTEEIRRQEQDNYRVEIPEEHETVIPANLRKKRRDLRAVLRKLYRPIQPGRRAVGGDVAEIRRTENQLWHNEQQIRRGYYGLFASPDQSLPRLADIYRRLGENTALVVYTLLRDSWGAYIVGRGKLTLVPLAINTDGLTDLLSRTYFFLEKHAYPYSYRRRNYPAIKSGIHRYCRNLAEKIWHPLEEYLAGYDNVVVIPHQQISIVPFPALSAKTDELLYQKWRLEMAGSLSEWMKTETDPTNPRHGGVVFAPGYDDSDAVAREADAIRQVFPGVEVLAGSTATRESFLESLSEPFRFVHAISHASVSVANPFCSEILLSDGPFYGFDLFAVPVKAKLVTLSACQTGRPGFFGEVNTLALSDTFLTAGAGNTVGSLWPISENSTVEFMAHFYGQWAKSNSIYRSWVSAIDYIRSIDDDPYHWAPFRLLGRVADQE